MPRRILTGLALVVLAAILSPLGGARAAEFPTRSIELIVPYPPGGSSDAIARGLGPTLEKVLGQTVVVINKPGAAGAVAASLVARAKPDGYTILLASSSALTLVPRFDRVEYEPLRDFTYIGLVTRLSSMLLVQSEAPWKTFDELVEYARRNPKKIKYGASGRAGTYLGMEAIAREKGIELVHVPFKGDGPAINALLGGHVDAAALYSAYVPHVRAGKLRPLLALTGFQVRAFPEVPTIKDVGLKFVGKGSTESITGIIAPRGVSADVVRKYEEAIKAAIAAPEFLKVAQALDVEPHFLTSEEYRKEMEESSRAVGEVFQGLGLK